MRPLAVLSDIHGNVRALEAVLADIAARGLHRIVNLGDSAYGPFDPAPVLDRLLALDLPTVAGNEDRLLVEATQGAPSSRTAAFCAGKLTRSHIAWLAGLPRTLRIPGACAFHGAPGDDTRYLLTTVTGTGPQARAPAAVRRLLPRPRRGLFLCGHDHTPRVVSFDDGILVVNPGSVGCPAFSDDMPCRHDVETGSPDARYALLEFSGRRPVVELVSVAYDSEAAAAEAAANGFPDWAHWLATGRAGGPQT